ncbi:alpha-amylase [Marinobacter lacisalsi]|uniref:Alpha-amylase n=1 Tax=Marinobacter lacisalsi TaxID=475979 RepID=A0ABV8QJR7_9GAMM
MFRSCFSITLACLPILALLGCATPQPAGIQLSAASGPTEWADSEARIAHFAAGDYELKFGSGSSEVQPAKVYLRNDFTPPHNATYQFTVKKAGFYRLHVASGTRSHFRIVKAKAPQKNIGAAPLRPANSGPDSCNADYRPLTVPVSDVFNNGEWLQDAYSGRKAQVKNGTITLAPAPDSNGLLLLEAANAQTHEFHWANATVYFVMTDRFANGRANNDHSYGRQSDGKQEIGTFHGGDFAGLTEKLDYLEDLGINTLWLSPPFEQIHGWVGGGDRGDFRHYGYHGYYTLDFTRLDANMGTRKELRTLVEQAHQRGIRILFDVVMNHPGYATLQDMQTFEFGGLREGFEQYLPDRWGDWRPSGYDDFHDYHAMIDYGHEGWSRWWGKDWVRASIADYHQPPNLTVDPQKGSLAFLPDFKTESDDPVKLPPFLAEKADSGASPLRDAAVRDYLINWLTGWVREFGIDGFRVDTAKHVEPQAWAELKQAAQQAWEDYYNNHPDQQRPSNQFWMVGEVFPHGMQKSRYFDYGFDAIINFDFQKRHARDGARCLSNMEPVFAEYADKLNSDEDFNVMSYISSHDTKLFSQMADDESMQKGVAPALLLLPGAVQLFYGDETARPFGPSGSDPTQGTRSDMNWTAIKDEETAALLEHWRKISQFRNRHPAIGGGTHRKLSDAPYAFSRTRGADRVIVAVGEKRR